MLKFTRIRPFYAWSAWLRRPGIRHAGLGLLRTEAAEEAMPLMLWPNPAIAELISRLER